MKAAEKRFLERGIPAEPSGRQRNFTLYKCALDLIDSGYKDIAKCRRPEKLQGDPSQIKQLNDARDFLISLLLNADAKTTIVKGDD